MEQLASSLILKIIAYSTKNILLTLLHIHDLC